MSNNGYYSAYQRRLNKHGNDLQSRIQGQREHNFDNYLLKSLYRVDCKYQDITFPATLEKYKQDHTETQCYLLTKISEKIPCGTILTIEKNGTEHTHKWMVWWKEQIEASGYNRYVVLKMSDEFTWTTDKDTIIMWGYLSGPGSSLIRDTLEGSASAPLYRENQNLYMVIMPYNSQIKIDTYMEITLDKGTTQENTTAFVVTNLDIHSSPGLMYVSIEPTYVHSKQNNTTEVPTSQDHFWITGGVE